MLYKCVSTYDDLRLHYHLVLHAGHQVVLSQSRTAFAELALCKQCVAMRDTGQSYHKIVFFSSDSTKVWQWAI